MTLSISPRKLSFSRAHLFCKAVLFGLFLIAGQLPAVSQQGYHQPLDGEWFFRADSLRIGLQEKWYDKYPTGNSWQKVTVPAEWETYEDLGLYDGWGWYSREFTNPGKEGPLSIYFHAVDDDAVVWVNGVEVGRHSGHSEPFSVEITGALHPGLNKLTVLVNDFAGGGGIDGGVLMIETEDRYEFLKSRFYGTPAVNSAEWVKKAVIYEVYLRSFSQDGTFSSLEKRLPELNDLGVTVIWLMPIHPVGEEKRKGKLGSPYSVKDYYGINPEFGTLNDFRSLVTAVHKEGMKIIIDLVANHTAWDNQLIENHPEWYTHDASGRIVPPNEDWTDVADLDFSQPGLRKYMLEMMLYWVREIDIDGYRCDVAELVPTSFWEEARARLDSVKEVLMLSEGSIPEHHAKAFDITYSWTFYDVLGPIISEQEAVSRLDDLLENETYRFPTGSLRLRFNTNHDKNAWEAPAPVKFGTNGAAITTVLVNTLPGIPLIYNGQEVGNDLTLGLFDKTVIEWNGSAETRALFRSLFQLRKEHAALAGGEMIRIESKEEGIYAFARVKNKSRVIVVLNFSSEAVQSRLQLPSELFLGGDSLHLQEVFSGDTFGVGRNDLLETDLTGRDYSVFVAGN